MELPERLRMLSAVHAWNGDSSQRGMQDSGHRVTFSADAREFHAEGCRLGVTRLPADPPVRLRVHTKRYSLLRVGAALTGTCIASQRSHVGCYTRVLLPGEKA